MTGATLCGLVVGCGGGTETVTVGSTTATQPLSKAEFIAQADAICGDTKPKTDPLIDQAQAASDAGDYEKAADLFDQAVQISKAGADRIEALPEPAIDKNALQRVDDLRAQGIALIERVSDALRDQDFARVTELGDEIKSIDDESDGIELGYGFKVCGKD